jgi:hypothetical protein
MQHSYFDYYRASQLVVKFLALAKRNSKLTLLCSYEPNTKPEYEKVKMYAYSIS